MQWKEGQVSLSILEKFSSGFFLAGQPAIPILDANPTHCQTASKILQGRVAAYYFAGPRGRADAKTSDDFRRKEPRTTNLWKPSDVS